MKKLIEKLEAATEGSRELDCRIWCLRQGFTYRRYQQGTTDQFFYDDDTGSPQVISGFPPHYTTSLDAALTLVPEGYTWEVSSPMFLTDLERKPAAFVWPPSRCGGPKPYGATPALALCVAALKALDKP